MLELNGNVYLVRATIILNRDDRTEVFGQAALIIFVFLFFTRKWRRNVEKRKVNMISPSSKNSVLSP